MLVGITKPTFFHDEAAQICFWLEHGIDVIHIRKPEASIKEIRMLLEVIPTAYFPQLTLHQHHDLVEEFNLGGVHFREPERIKISEDQLIYWKNRGKRLSSSVHQTEEIVYIPELFDYLFLSPVFDSISKKGYQSNKAILNTMKTSSFSRQMIALGGISPQTIPMLDGTSFNGAALLGYLWEDSSAKLLSKSTELLTTWRTLDLSL
ncbi:thiamine phosphate synthase [Flammeovirga yaeyamensis]|uniref:Thiamine phosphate synthase n=1 Tax=Flammeovirga yaeyamensis TaxID=367791 RepID=A0AAX1N502_9BACT|nr:thiamine phosphate synthase [Flammeovirga yaeyamensis]MBB3701454.1 thiamine-phosphate pyrophosphorylase [Flammeovirga yaeyamensis]NMF38514.1 thiamine phosphate synthase [Flammeovirga yaeyamensis]QWG02406.1 thiamine phosphate synthase [Flammeovirga yaeyamensis]